MSYTICTEHFSGPIAKLVELIEEKKLDIRRVSLSEVTEDFLSYIETLESCEPTLIADFMVTASHLLLIKSKALLPQLVFTKEEQEDIRSLEQQVSLYKDIKDARENIMKRWREALHLVGRPLFLGVEKSFTPPSDSYSIPRVLLIAIQEIEKMRKTYDSPKEVLSIKTISLESKIEELLSRVENAKTTHFSNLMDQKKKNEIIVLFLAMLHLVRERAIFVFQGKNFDEIIINR